MSNPIRFAGELYRISHAHLLSLDRQTTITIKVPTVQFEQQMAMLTAMMGHAVDVTIQPQ